MFLVELSEDLGTEEVGLGLIGVGLGVEALSAGQVLLAILAGGTSQKCLYLPNIFRGGRWHFVRHLSRKSHLVVTVPLSQSMS